MSDIEQESSSQQTNGSWLDRWFDNSPILSTGQKLIAYQIAGLCDLLKLAIDFFIIATILNSGVDAGNSITGTVILDIILIIGLFAGESAARNFTLFRAFAGALVLPFIVWAQLGFAMAALSLVLAVIRLIVDLLLLTGTTTKYRLFQAGALQFAMMCIGSGIAFPLVSSFLAFENPLELRCDVKTYDAIEKSPSVLFPISSIFKPGLNTKPIDEFTFSVDYEYQPLDRSIRHAITISITETGSGQLISEQNLDYLTNRVVKNVENAMPHSNVYFATGWVIVQHPDTHRNLRYICIPYPYRPDSTDDDTAFGAILKQFYEDRRR